MPSILNGLWVIIKIFTIKLKWIFISRYHTSLNATLKIFSVQEGDEGSYQCVAKNEGDAAQSVGFLWLGGKYLIPKIKSTKTFFLN